MKKNGEFRLAHDIFEPGVQKSTVVQHDRKTHWKLKMLPVRFVLSLDKRLGLVYALALFMIYSKIGKLFDV